MSAGAEPGRRRRAKEGFTLVELLVVVVTVGLLASMAAPKLQRALLRARAAEVAGDVRAVRLALVEYVSEQHQYPPDGALGVVPPELVPYLPENFSFRGEGYALDYDDWRGVIAVSVVTDEAELASAVLDMLGNDAWAGGSGRWVSLAIDWS